LDRPHRFLHDAVLVVGAAGNSILRLRNAEEQHRADAVPSQILHLGRELIDADLVDPRHRGYRAAHSTPVGDEEGLDAVARRQARLAHQAPQALRPAQPAEAAERQVARIGQAHARLLSASATSAATSPGIVCSSATRSTRRPTSRAVAAVIGPMQATRARLMRSTRPDASATRLRAVEELVSVTTSISPASSARSPGASGGISVR